MAELAQQRCLNHTEREAAARCPACAQFFCRECITEHEGIVICAACLRRQSAPATARRTRWNRLGRLGLAAAGVLAAWLWFYSAGQILLSLPSGFHEGTLWKMELTEP